MKKLFVLANVFIVFALFTSCESEVTVQLNDHLSTPVLQSVAKKNLQEGETLSIDFNNQQTGDDNDSTGNALAYSCSWDSTLDGDVSSPTDCSSGLSGEFSFDSSTGELIWEIGYFAYEAGGTYEFKITATSLHRGSEVIFSVEVSGSTPFVSIWRTTTPGESITLPLRSGYTYDFEVDWGDGSTSTITAWDDTDKTHSYISAEDYTVTITGYAEAWYFGDGAYASNRDQILSVSELGDLGWKNFEQAFSQCLNLTSFLGGNVSNVTNMSNMFYSSINVDPDVSDWDTSNVTDMSAMFDSATNASPYVSYWDTSSVIYAFYVF